jgi:uncharacterized protein DUF3108
VTRALAAAALAAALAACGDVRPTVSGPPDATTSEYQPLVVGWKWRYQIDGGGECVRAVVARENVGRFECRVMEESASGVARRWWLRSDRDGLKLYRFAEGPLRQDLDDPAVWFRYPARRGAKWEYDAEHGSVELRCYGVYEDDERVRTAAGEFTCARVRTFAFCERTQVYEKVEWYAKGIGLVRQTVKTYEGQSASMSLKEIAR